MNESQPSHLADSDLPISAENLHLYGRFWDVLSVLIFGFAAVAVLASHAGDLTWREWAVAGLSVAQGALYLFCIRGGGWPISQKNLTIYFVGGVCMWVLACWLNPFAWWLGFTYFGQMFGLLPLWGVVFGTAVVTFFILLIISDWNITQIPVGAAFGFSFMWIGGMAVFLFIYGLSAPAFSGPDLITKLESAQNQAAYGVPSALEVATARKARENAYEGTLNPFADFDAVTVPTYLPKRGTDHPMEIAARELPPVATPDAVRRLKAAGDTRTDLYAQLIAEHGAEVPAAWLDAQLSALQGGVDGRKASGF